MARSYEVTMRGGAVTLVGQVPEPGDPAPDFSAVTTALQDFRLRDLRGRVVLIVSIPSLDTPVCDTEIRRFNEDAGNLGLNVQVLVVSMDLPFAQVRWCGAAGVDRVMTVSDYRERAFGDSWGLRIREVGLLARAVSVVDTEGVVRYMQVVSEVGKQPDFDAAVKAARALL